MRRTRHMRLMVLFIVMVGLTLSGMSNSIAFHDGKQDQLLLRDARVKENINVHVTRNFEDVGGVPPAPSLATTTTTPRLERVGFLSKDVLRSLIQQARLLRANNGRSNASVTTWLLITFSDVLKLNVTLRDITFINASEVVRAIHPTKGFVRPTGINDVYIVKGPIRELTSNERGYYQFIFTQSILFGSISLETKNAWIDPVTRLSTPIKAISNSERMLEYKLTIFQKIDQEKKDVRLTLKEIATISSSAASTRTALVIAAGTGSFYNEWGADLVAAMVYNIDGADQYTWLNEGSYLVPKDANDVFKHYFGLTLSIKRIFYWPVGGPGNDPRDCFKLANATADFVRNLLPSDPVFPFHIFVMFSGKSLENSFGVPVQGCVVDKTTRIKQVNSPSDLPTRESVPVVVVQSRSSDSGHLRRFATAHEIGHLLGGKHDNAGTITLVKWLLGVTGTRCDFIYKNTVFFLFAWTLMSEGYSGTVVCVPGWFYTDFFISSGNQQQMEGVISSVF